MLKIYKIIDNTNGNIYIGKTEQTLKQRLTKHKHDFKIGKNCSSRQIIKNGDYKIELIEETHDETRERYWILSNECVNVSIPGRTVKEWGKDNKEYLRKKDKRKDTWMTSMGGRPYQNNMSLLKIDPNLFLF